MYQLLILLRGHVIFIKKFVSNINNWQIERNKTNRGFYTFSSTTPNASKLSGTKLPNFQLYVPRFLNF